MSDFLNSIDPTNLAVVVRNLVQRVGMLEAQLRSGSDSFNGQVDAQDDGINIVEQGRILAGIDTIWTPTAPVAALVTTGTGNIDNGSHEYKVTFLDASGNETTASAASNAVTTDASHKQTTVTIPVGPWGTSDRNIYRNTVAGSTEFVFHSSVGNNTSVTITDNLADATILASTHAGAPSDSLNRGRALFPTSAFIWGDQFKVVNSGGVAVTIAVAQNTTAWTGAYWGPATADANNGDQYIVPVFLMAGIYTCIIWATKAPSCGKVDWYLDGVSQTTGQDWYASGIDYSQIGTFTLTVLENGWHELRAIVNGKNGSSSDYRFIYSAITIK